MEDTVIQGRPTTEGDVELIRRLMNSNPSWHRTRLSKELCELWNWRGDNGQKKDMAARSFLLKLEARGANSSSSQANKLRGNSKRARVADVPHSSDPIRSALKELRPITVEPVRGSRDLALFKCLISNYHYLSFHLVGRNMKYLAFDRHERPLAALLFGSAAWKCAPRDEFIGWDAERREASVNLITSNTRFLVLPWVEVPHLASHVLGQVARRISTDWEERYNHPVHLLETFVDRERFRGTSYRAANWTRVGSTRGRSRNDRYYNINVPVKDVYLYPLAGDFREHLCR